jgi:hypothetical protein
VEIVGNDALKETFPDCRAMSIGWGEPFCFKCGWLSPVPEAADYPTEWSYERVINKVWNSAAGWLERAHLQDHWAGGGSEPLNLVPLCPLCHESQPPCRTREEGVAFVNEASSFAPLTWAAQLITEQDRTRRNPGRGAAVRSMLCAYALAGLTSHNAALETVKTFGTGVPDGTARDTPHAPPPNR